MLIKGGEIELYSNKIKRIINIMLAFYIISFSIPFNYIYGIPYKTIVFLLILFCSLLLFLINNKIIDILNECKFEIFVFFVGILWCIYGYINNYSTSSTFFNILYITPVFFTVIYLLNKYNFLHISFLYKSLFIMLSIKIFEKLFLECIFLFNILDYEEIRDLYLNIFKSNIITMTFNIGNITFMRIQNSSDVIFFSLIPFFILDKNIHSNWKILLLFLSFIYTFIVFSRLFIVHFISICLIFILYYWKSFNNKIKYIFLLTCFFGIVFILSSDDIFFIIKDRFFSNNSLFSDPIRNEQSIKLINGFFKSPLIGHGMGSYINDYIRSLSIPFSYEKEYLSFLYQFGIVGFITIILGVIYIYIRRIFLYLKRCPAIVQKFTILSIFWFLIRPLFNPSFLGLENCFFLIGILLINIFYTQNEVIKE